MINFKDIKFSINGGSGVLADNASLSLSNSLTPLFTVGSRGVSNQFPTTQVRGTVTASYTAEVDNEPNFAIVSFLRTGFENFNYNPAVVSLAGLSGSFHLTTYSLSLANNSPAQVSVGFDTFYPVTGNIGVDTLSYNPSDQTQIGHSWTTYFLKNGAIITTGKISDFKYDFRAKWGAEYILGQKNPIQVSLQSAEEEIQITREVYKNILFSGEDSFTNLDIDTIRIYGIINVSAITNQYLEFNLQSGKVINVVVNGSTNDILRVTNTIKKYY
jgi:hypothetical protein